MRARAATHFGDKSNAPVGTVATILAPPAAWPRLKAQQGLTDGRRRLEGARHLVGVIEPATLVALRTEDRVDAAVKKRRNVALVALCA